MPTTLGLHPAITKTSLYTLDCALQPCTKVVGPMCFSAVDTTARYLRRIDPDDAIF